MGLTIKTIIELHAIALVAGFFLDLIIGDPHWLYHPVRLIGLLISLCEKIFLGKSDKAESDSKGGKKIFLGILTVIIVLCFTFVITGAIVFWSYYFNKYQN